MKTLVNSEGLLALIEADGKVKTVSNKGHSAEVVFPDGSSCWLRLDNRGWRFLDGCSAYAAGYAYACGYRD